MICTVFIKANNNQFKSLTLIGFEMADIQSDVLGLSVSCHRKVNFRIFNAFIGCGENLFYDVMTTNCATVDLYVLTVLTI